MELPIGLKYQQVMHKIKIGKKMTNQIPPVNGNENENTSVNSGLSSLTQVASKNKGLLILTFIVGLITGLVLGVFIF